MLEIFVLVSACVGIAGMAKKKGRTAAGYVAMLVVFWFGSEFVAGFICGLLGMHEMGVIFVAALLGAATGCGISFLIVALLPDIKRQTDYSNRRYGYAPNLPNSDAPYDPANPYAAPQRSNSTDLPPVVLDPNDVMGWLDQQQRKS